MGVEKPACLRVVYLSPVASSHASAPPHQPVFLPFHTRRARKSDSSAAFLPWRAVPRGDRDGGAEPRNPAPVAGGDRPRGKRAARWQGERTGGVDKRKGGACGAAKFREETSKKADSAVKDRIAAMHNVADRSFVCKRYFAMQHPN